MEVRFRLDADRTSAAFKQTRRGLRAKVRQGLIAGGREHVLPAIQRRAPSVVRRNITTRATSTAGYITTSGPKKQDRITGLLNFGGTVRAPIRPKRAKGLSIAPGVVRASVTGPRTYRGTHFLERGLTAAKPGLEDRLLESVLDSLGELADN